MPLRGPVVAEYVVHDLLRVMEDVDPPPMPTEVGKTLRDEAVAFVRDGFALDNGLLGLIVTNSSRSTIV